MSKPNPNYKGSTWDKVTRWEKGTYDPADGQLESTPPRNRLSPGERAERMLREYDQSRFEEGVAKEIGAFQIVSRIFFVLMALFMVIVLLYTVSFLPAFGDPNSPVNNEVSQRYIEQGLEETGAVNIVAGMILDYRAFDTFGESCVLFVALCCVTILLRADRKDEIRLRNRENREDQYYEPGGDNILQQAAKLLVPPHHHFRRLCGAQRPHLPGRRLLRRSHHRHRPDSAPDRLRRPAHPPVHERAGHQDPDRLRPDLLLLRQELLLLHRSQRSGEHHHHRHPGGHPQRGAHRLPEHLRGHCGGLHHVFLLYSLPEGGNLTPWATF